MQRLRACTANNFLQLLRAYPPFRRTYGIRFRSTPKATRVMKTQAWLGLAVAASVSSIGYASTQEELKFPGFEQYRYKPLINDNHIRLLRLEKSTDDKIHGGLQEVDLNQAPQFVAMSYTWALPDRIETDNLITEGSFHTIYIDSFPVTISQNLHNALQHLQHNKFVEEVHFWIDRLCIDQSNAVEKEVQVERLGDIFQEAFRVVVWLGKDERRDGRLVESMIDDLADRKTAPPNHDLPTFQAVDDLTNPSILHENNLRRWRKAHWLLLGRFFHNRWFRRVWCAQEVILAQDMKKILVLYGDTVLDWESVVKAQETMFKTGLTRTINELVFQHVHPALLSRGPVGSEVFGLWSVYELLKPETASRRIESMSAQTGQDPDNFNGYSFLVVLLWLLPNREATDGRDRINGLLGLVNRFCEIHGIERISLKPNYTDSTEEVFRKATRAIMRGTCPAGVQRILKQSGVDEEPDSERSRWQMRESKL